MRRMLAFVRAAKRDTGEGIGVAKVASSRAYVLMPLAIGGVRTVNQEFCKTSDQRF